MAMPFGTMIAVSSMNRIADLLTTHDNSSFLNIPKDEVLSILSRHGEVLARAPGKGAIDEHAHTVGVPQSQIKACKVWEGLHLTKELDRFERVYICISGAIVRYSTLEEVDFYWLNQKDKEFEVRTQLVKAPWETNGNLVSLAYLVSHTRLFDITYECQMTGTTELLTSASRWMTSTFQRRNSEVLALDKQFLDSLSPESRSIFFQNSAMISIVTWAERCRDRQELLACAAAGEAQKTIAQGLDATPNSKDRHGDRSLFVRQLALECLQRMAMKRLEQKPELRSSKLMSIDGNFERLAYYIGMRPPGFKGAWSALCGNARRKTPIAQVINKQNRPGGGRANYSIDIDVLAEELGASKFRVQLQDIFSGE